jgi:hypothetical protein
MFSFAYHVFGACLSRREVRMAKSTKTASTKTESATARELALTRTTPTRPRKTRTRSLPAASAAPNHHDIASRAYELFLREGAMHGRDLEHWLKAESELRGSSVAAN